MKKFLLTALCWTPFFVFAEPLNFNDMAKKCAKDIDVNTMQAIARTESSFNPYAIGVVSGSLKQQPTNLADAVAAVKMLREQGKNFSMGLVQVNRQHMKAFGLTDESIFDICINLRVGGEILKDCFSRAIGDAQQRLQQALSCYYSGNFVRGFASSDNYVARVINNAKENSPNQTIRQAEKSGRLVKVNGTVPAIDTTRPVRSVSVVKSSKKKTKNIRQAESIFQAEGISHSSDTGEKRPKQSWDVFGEF